MKTMRMLAVFTAASLLSATGAGGLQSNPQCVRDARLTRKDCAATCDEQFKVSKDSCLNVNHACADACRAGRSTCFDQPLSALQSCVAGCNATLDAKTADCRSQFAEGTPERDHCIDDAQVVAFQCRDVCREALDRNALRLCRQAFHACMNACPPAN